MYSSWSDEDLKKRLNQILKDYEVISSEVLPKLTKLNNLQNEVLLIREQIIERGIEIDTEKERG